MTALPSRRSNRWRERTTRFTKSPFVWSEPVCRNAFGSMSSRRWRRILGSLPTVELTKTCVDPRLQWSQAGNLRYNAAMLTMLYTISTPVRRIFRREAK